MTERYKCRNTSVSPPYEDNMTFFLTEDAVCNCGITNPGYVILERYGENLTDVVQGSLYALLPGWTTCECYDMGGQPLPCGKADVKVDFKSLIGTDY
jgi:hypothetical protein